MSRQPLILSPGIVEVSGYDIKKIVRDWKELSNIKLPKKLPSYTAR